MSDIGKDPACCATCKRVLDETKRIPPKSGWKPGDCFHIGATIRLGTNGGFATVVSCPHCGYTDHPEPPLYVPPVAPPTVAEQESAAHWYHAYTVALASETQLCAEVVKLREEVAQLRCDLDAMHTERDEARANHERALEHLASGASEQTRLRTELREALDGRQRDRDEFEQIATAAWKLLGSVGMR